MAFPVSQYGKFYHYVSILFSCLLKLQHIHTPLVGSIKRNLTQYLLIFDPYLMLLRTLCRNMSPRERRLVLHKRKLRNRISARKSRERRMKTVTEYDRLICGAFGVLGKTLGCCVRIIDRYEETEKKNKRQKATARRNSKIVKTPKQPRARATAPKKKGKAVASPKPAPRPPTQGNAGPSTLPLVGPSTMPNAGSSSLPLVGPSSVDNTGSSSSAIPVIDVSSLAHAGPPSLPLVGPSTLPTADPSHQSNEAPPSAEIVGPSTLFGFVPSFGTIGQFIFSEEAMDVGDETPPIVENVGSSSRNKPDSSPRSKPGSSSQHAQLK